MEVALQFLCTALRQAHDKMHNCSVQWCLRVVQWATEGSYALSPGLRARRNVLKVIQIRVSALESSVVITKHLKSCHCVKAVRSPGQRLSRAQCFHIKCVCRTVVCITVSGVAHEWCGTVRCVFVSYQVCSFKLSKSEFPRLDYLQ